ncbi:MAG TPA: hypothetical protein VN838_06770 [Bradyrhizobium sp.]|nr:hypothetical protein [Bradyrhizobium sp.]
MTQPQFSPAKRGEIVAYAMEHTQTTVKLETKSYTTWGLGMVTSVSAEGMVKALRPAGAEESIGRHSFGTILTISAPHQPAARAVFDSRTRATNSFDDRDALKAAILAEDASI